jgi:uncharacterized protein (TIGR02266 family)
MTGEQREGVSGGEERRTEERIPAKVEVHFKQTDHAARALRAYSLNFSAGGLCLRTDRRYEVGAALTLSLRIAGEAFSLTGAVAWVRDGAVGVRFDRANPDDVQTLDRLLALLKG